MTRPGGALVLALVLMAAACGSDTRVEARSNLSSDAESADAAVDASTSAAAESPAVETAEADAPEEAALADDAASEQAEGEPAEPVDAQPADETPAQSAEPPIGLDHVQLALELVDTATAPLAMASRSGTDDLYVAEQTGRIRRLPGGAGPFADEPVLDVSDLISVDKERGLLGLVFSPDGSRLYVNYTDPAGDTVVARYPMGETTADAGLGEVLLTFDQPRKNHNGGHLAFGPDGLLYIGSGDGGGKGDPFDNGQDPANLLGAILRVDVDFGVGYAIPPDNPFADGGGAPEVFAYGARNPWKFSFDAETGDLWIADVGQDGFEEITVLRAADGGGNGANLGWNELEGFVPFRGGSEPADHAPPIAAYPHERERCSVTGGEVYRGTDLPGLTGTYVFGDFCTGELLGIEAASGDGSIVELDVDGVENVTSFGSDASGELYALSGAGGVFKVVPR